MAECPTFLPTQQLWFPVITEKIVQGLKEDEILDMEIIFLFFFKNVVLGYQINTLQKYLSL